MANLSDRKALLAFSNSTDWYNNDYEVLDYVYIHEACCKGVSKSVFNPHPAYSQRNSAHHAFTWINFSMYLP